MDTTQLALAERAAEQQRHHGKALFFWVWGALLVMTAIEVFLTYQNMQPVKMLTILMGLSLIKAALIIGYFMHLKYGVSRMKWLTMCSVGGWLILNEDLLFPGAFSIPLWGMEWMVVAPLLSLWCSWGAPRRSA